jgi:hypothetical protein
MNVRSHADDCETVDFLELGAQVFAFTFGQDRIYESAAAET